MLTVALTGGIAAGKSVVARVFAAQGCALFRADEIARSLMSRDGPAYGPLVARFGPAILGREGAIDRKKLAGVVFGDEEGRRFVNRTVHPLVAEERRREISRLEAEDKTTIFVSEAALTIEAGLQDGFDKIVVVWCPPETQLARLMARDGLRRDEALRRLEAQMPVEEKLRYADYIIDASGSLERTIAQAVAVHAKLLEDYEFLRAAAKRGTRISWGPMK
jgi:dephospho-CoA kinase